jgi:hypothetical protein
MRGPVTILIWVAAAALLFEEWFWALSTRAIARLSAIAHLQSLDSWIRRQPPTQALMLFVVPIIVIYPFKVLALIALANGDIALGGAAFVAAKLAATAVFAWLYEATEPAILHFAWIRLAKRKFLAVRASIHAWLNARPAYRQARALMRRRSANLAYRYRVACRLHGRRRYARTDTSAYGAEAAVDYRSNIAAGDRSRGARHR